MGRGGGALTCTNLVRTEDVPRMQEQLIPLVTSVMLV